MVRNKTQFYNGSQSGFTVIELMVVFLIMTTISALVLIGWNQQRPNRLMTIAENELVTNIRKMQSYAISSRNISSDVPARYYVLRIAEGESTYTINAIGTDYAYYSAVETLQLPDGVAFSDLQLRPTGSTSTTTPSCIMVIVSSPFGKMYFDTVSSCGATVASTVQDLPALATQVDKDLDIYFAHSQQSLSRSVGIHGLTGRVEAN